MQQSHRQQEQDLHELEVRGNRLDVELNHLFNKLAEEYEISFERAKQQYPVPEEPKQAEKEVRSLKGKIAALGDVNTAAVVDGQEDVCRLFKVRQRRLQAERILSVEQQESHGRSEEDDVRLGVFAKLFVFEVLLPEGNHVVGEPVILDALDVLAR